MSGRPVYYWDTPIFVAWITDEKRPPGDMEGVTAIVQDIEKDKADLITSALTRLEVLEAKVGEDANADFEEFLERPDLTVATVDLSVIEVAYKIRNYYRANNEFGKTVSVPDAIHLATAIVHQATVFHTFDAENRKETLGLIPLSGTLAGEYPLQIEKPSAQQIDAFGGA